MVLRRRFSQFPCSGILIVTNYSAFLFGVISWTGRIAKNCVLVTVAGGMGHLMAEAKRRSLVASRSCF